MESDLAEQFHVSRSPVREALQALESEGTLSATPYAGAMVKPLSAAEICEIADIRLGLISLALKPAHPHLAPAHFDLASDLAKRITRTKSAREAFDCNRRFWDILFENAERPILWEMFQKLDDRMTRYYPLLLKELYPNPGEQAAPARGANRVVSQRPVRRSIKSFQEDLPGDGGSHRRSP
jgi:DNA-binding GntR family transcriptional regulator